MIKKLLRVVTWLLIILISLFLGLQVQSENKPTPAPTRQPVTFLDIEPKTITFEDYIPPRKAKDIGSYQR
jgi:hypothetical protein